MSWNVRMTQTILDFFECDSSCFCDYTFFLINWPGVISYQLVWKFKKKAVNKISPYIIEELPLVVYVLWNPLYFPRSTYHTLPYQWLCKVSTKTRWLCSMCLPLFPPLWFYLFYPLPTSLKQFYSSRLCVIRSHHKQRQLHIVHPRHGEHWNWKSFSKLHLKMKESLLWLCICPNEQRLELLRMMSYRATGRK